MMRAALDLAACGWEVLPLLVPNGVTRSAAGKLVGKEPDGRLAPRGVLDATTDPDTIRAWWERSPRANIGARVPANVFVFDVDPRNGGADGLARLTDAYGPLPSTLTAISGRGDGGSHRYYRAPVGKVTTRPLRLAGGDGIDVKTHAGYCVVPPSIHPDTGQPYWWVDDVAPISDPPAWLLDLLQPPPPPARPAPRLGRDSASIADSYTAATSWVDVLTPHGWRCLDLDPDRDGARWLHPAATSSCSATIRHGCLFVYSTNTPFDPTEPGDPRGITRFRAYAVLNHGGDLSAAARALTMTGAN